ncbi:MAG: ComF family protein [Trichococcus flocculiformis]|jgi:competence protein ComFC|nr:ComF family protein [Trichococcus sp.]HQZ19519.1 ComF family protein [Trichococcus flocculiformis]MBP6247202.1 ComF family protein [Trichococcus sp.]MBP7128631.1 ComF family protein [Trichococcus sp.]MBP8683017.1 ComF family protein [Trichococcus sp.]
MGQCLFCQNEIREVLTLQELFGFGKKNRGRVCRSCEEKLPRLAGQTVCPGCMRPQASSVDLCEDCRRWRSCYPELTIAHHACYAYTGIVKDWLQRYKFQGDYRLAGAFTNDLQALQRTHPQALFLPLPISIASYEERGFNQCEELLKQAGIRCVQFLGNQHAGEKQSEKNRQERLLTMQPFLLLEGYEKYLQQEIILFDDVYTTGRTLYHAKILLYKHGFRMVRSTTIAR